VRGTRKAGNVYCRVLWCECAWSQRTYFGLFLLPEMRHQGKMMRSNLRFGAFLFGILLVLPVWIACQKKKSEAPAFIVHVLRDPSSPIARNLRQAGWQFASAKPHLSSGRALTVATNEGSSYPRRAAPCRHATGLAYIEFAIGSPGQRCRPGAYREAATGLRRNRGLRTRLGFRGSTRGDRDVSAIFGGSLRAHDRADEAVSQALMHLIAISAPHF
jgi:hypothetical protein